MAHKYETVNRSKLDSPKRREVLPVGEIMNLINVKSSEVVADIGCGIGYFTFAFSEAVGDSGQVYALDIEPAMLKDVTEKMEKCGIQNIIPVLTKESNLILQDGVIETAFLCTVLHEVEESETFLKEVKRILRPDGRIIIVEWIRKDSDFGPPTEHRLDQKLLEKNLLKTGFQEIESIDFNNYFYVVTANRSKEKS